MSNILDLKSIASNNISEAEFVDSFLKNNKLFCDHNLNYYFLKEKVTDGGIPDIVVVSWEKKKEVKWNDKRKKLSKIDIQILHFVAKYRTKGVSQRYIEKKLGFDKRQIEKTTSKLIDAELVDLVKSRLILKNFNSTFFVKDIIAIEAKLKNWKKAAQQAFLNQNFSSLSYVLMPKNRNNVKECLLIEKSTGLIIYDGVNTIIKKKAKKNKLPGSLYSWVINEHIGNLVYG